MTIILILLGLAALYCGGMWLFCFVQFMRGRIAPSSEIELHTFHLGLCFTLAVGFFGVILAIGG